MIWHYSKDTVRLGLISCGFAAVLHFYVFVFLQEWQPPFSVELDSFHFTPRVQRLNELEVCFCLPIHFIVILHSVKDLPNLGFPHLCRVRLKPE